MSLLLFLCRESETRTRRLIRARHTFELQSTSPPRQMHLRDGSELYLGWLLGFHFYSRGSMTCISMTFAFEACVIYEPVRIIQCERLFWLNADCAECSYRIDLFVLKSKWGFHIFQVTMSGSQYHYYNYKISPAVVHEWKWHIIIISAWKSLLIINITWRSIEALKLRLKWFSYNRLCEADFLFNTAKEIIMFTAYLHLLQWLTLIETFLICQWWGLSASQRWRKSRNSVKGELCRERNGCRIS